MQEKSGGGIISKRRLSKHYEKHEEDPEEFKLKHRFREEMEEFKFLFSWKVKKGDYQIWLGQVIA